MVDQTDQQIIKLPKENSKLDFKTIGEQIHMTGQAVGNRIRKLEEEGIIQGYTVRLNNENQGLFLAYIMLFMKNNDHYRVKQFVQEKPEITDAVRISGEGCYILTVEAPNHEFLNRLCDDILKFANYKINIVTERIK